MDAACSTRLGSVGFGAVLWGSQRRVVVTASMFMPTQVDVLAAEAIALLHGLKLADRFRCWNFSIESDSQVLVKAIHSYRLVLFGRQVTLRFSFSLDLLIVFTVSELGSV